MRVWGGVVGCVLLCASLSIGGVARATADAPIVIEGVGAAHGFGMAMDGVEGQARAGWSHDRILDLFYPGTSAGDAGGTIRVGLESSDGPELVLPSGGFISDAPRGEGSGAGFPSALGSGARISLRPRAGGVEIVSPLPRTRVAESEPMAQEEPPSLVPTPPPAPPLEPTPPPEKEKKAPPTPSPAEPEAPSVLSSVWVWGGGEAALVSVTSTGRRYRGLMEVKPVAGKLVVVNHVDLETYVAGIAEEKGQGWPAAGLEALAIAARTLGAATMSWYEKNQANGYDICPTAKCQLYLGYDGEEPAMSAATRATAGVIRTFRGRPILAMYHGNGGGQTESYKRAIGGGSDPHPYLASVTYPFADPSRWKERTTIGEISAALRAANVAVPGEIERIGIAERGASPRVLRVRIDGKDGDVDVSGTTFASALGLRSTWFDLGSPKPTEAIITSDVTLAPLQGTLAAPVSPRPDETWWAAAIVGAVASLLFGLAIHAHRRQRQKATGGAPVHHPAR